MAYDAAFNLGNSSPQSAGESPATSPNSRSYKFFTKREVKMALRSLRAGDQFYLTIKHPSAAYIAPIVPPLYTPLWPSSTLNDFEEVKVSVWDVDGTDAHCTSQMGHIVVDMKKGHVLKRSANTDEALAIYGIKKVLRGVHLG